MDFTKKTCHVIRIIQSISDQVNKALDKSRKNNLIAMQFMKIKIKEICKKFQGKSFK
ncbi:hypothetical protein LguiA_033420 [Lonicera macranthoides]